jgi:hypothetical protein
MVSMGPVRGELEKKKVEGDCGAIWTSNNETPDSEGLVPEIQLPVLLLAIILSFCIKPCVKISVCINPALAVLYVYN